MTTEEQIQQLRSLVKFATEGNVSAVDKILQLPIDINIYMLKRDGNVNLLQFTPMHIICYSLIGKKPIKQIMALALILTYGFEDKLPDKQGKLSFDLLPEKYNDNFKLFLISLQKLNLSQTLAIREQLLENYFILNETNDLKTIAEIEDWVKKLIRYSSKYSTHNHNKRIRLSAT